MNLLSKKVANVLFLSSLFLIILLTTILLFTSVLFIFNLSISVFSAVLSIFLAFVIYYFVCYKKQCFSKSEVIFGNCLAIVLVLIALILSNQIYDFAWDSNWYHKSAVGALKFGWNPFYEEFEEFVKTTELFENIKYAKTWAQHYCKASWITGANIYILTNNIEMAKSINLLMAFVLFGFSYHYLSLTRFKNWQAFIISVLLIFNPITCAQIFTLYVDNLLMTNLFAIIILLLGIADKDYKLNMWYKYFALSMLIIFCINIKFTGLAYAGVFCFVFFCIWCVKFYKRENFKKFFIRNMKFYIATCIIAIFIAGSSTYLTNIVSKGHPLYPLAGKDKIDIMSQNEPASFSDMSTLKKLFISIFAETNNIYNDEIPRLKPLFKVSEFELEIAAAGVDTRIGGFGPLFSGILVTSLSICVYSLIILYKKDKYWFYIFEVVLITIILMLSLITESWWARYSPYLYLVTIFAIAFLLIGYNFEIKYNKKVTFSIFAILLIIILINTSFFARYIIKSKEATDIAKAEFTELQKISKEERLKVNFVHGTLTGIEFNLIDNHINYEFVERTEIPGKDFYGGLAKIEK